MKEIQRTQRKMPSAFGRCVVALSIIVLSGAALRAQPTMTRATMDSVSSYFAGAWSCAGAFANGNPIAADLQFGRVLDNRWLSFAHTDRPPGRFLMQSLWGFDAASRELVAASADNGGSLRVFRAPNFSNGILVLERAAIGGPVTRPERFTYARQSDDALRMTYEFRSGSADWALGDTLSCKRRSPGP